MLNVSMWVLISTLLVTAIGQSAAPPDVMVAFNNSGNLYLTAFNGEVKQLTGEGTRNILPQWSADGRQMAYLSEPLAEPTGKLRLMVMEVATKEARPVGALSLDSEAQLAWSPDGTKIAVTLGAAYVVTVDSGETVKLSADGIGAQGPTWSPDSAAVAYSAMGEIYVVDVESQAARKIAEAGDGSYHYQPNWSGRTNQLLFVTNAPDGVIVKIYNPVTDITQVVLTLADNQILKPMWSPDGRQIAFMVSGQPTGDLTVVDIFDVYVMNADGSDLQALSSDGIDSVIGWTNDSAVVLYESQEAGGVAMTYFGVRTADGARIELHDATLDTMAAQMGIHQNMTVRPG